MYLWVFLFVGTVVCSSEKRPLFGLVKSPNYPKPYPNNNQTSWDIEVPEGYRVSLTFLVFDIEPSENCDYDFVKVLADQRQLGLFCGSAMSRTHPGSRRFVSQGKKMRIQFHSDFSNEENGTTIPYRGFQAYYQAIDRDECADPYDNSISWTPPCQQMCHNYVGGYFCSCLPGYQMQNDQRSCREECSNEMFTEESGSFSSPGYPQPYPPDLNCKYSIRLEQGMLISLSFQQLFEIDDHLQVHCPYDTLKIFAGENLLDSFCGSRSPGILMTNSNTVDITFQTDESGDSRGWRLDYTSEAIQCPNPVPRDQFSLISPTKKEYRMGDYIVVSCQTGYKLMEDNTELRSFTSLCQKDGTWHRVIPRCEIVSCKDPKPVTNGQIIFQTAPDRLTYQSVIQYHCNTPYYKMGTPIDTATFTCTADRQWKDANGGVKIPKCLPVCGKPDKPVTSSTRIISGKVAEPGNFPWQVLVLVNNQRAGGFLIGEHWVLTAAHNLWSLDKPVNDLSKVHVFLGDVEVEKQIGLGNHPVEELYLHPDYNSKNHDNDIALIRLQYPVVMNQNVAPICLPDPKNENFLYQANRIGYVSGYGITEHHSISNSLRYVKVPMVSREECQTYVDNVTGENKVFTPNMICAGYPERKHVQGDSCEGDSGGAYTTQNQEDTWVATGIVSWGIGCGRGYGIYTKVNSYVNWIQGYMMSQ